MHRERVQRCHPRRQPHQRRLWARRGAPHLCHPRPEAVLEWRTYHHKCNYDTAPPHQRRREEGNTLHRRRRRLHHTRGTLITHPAKEGRESSTTPKEVEETQHRPQRGGKQHHQKGAAFLPFWADVPFTLAPASLWAVLLSRSLRSGAAFSPSSCGWGTLKTETSSS